MAPAWQIGCKNRHADKNKKQLYHDDGDYRLRLQEFLYNPDYILRKIFQKDGPPLGVEFDSLPLGAFLSCDIDFGKSHSTCQQTKIAPKKRKVPESISLNQQECAERDGLVKKHGKGKGLMTLWRVTNPGAGDFPPLPEFHQSTVFQLPGSELEKASKQKNKKKPRKPQPVMKRKPNKPKEKKKPSALNRKVPLRNVEITKESYNDNCGLALEGDGNQESLDQFTMLLDDEELELRELKGGPNPPTCSVHFAADGFPGCSLCKDLLDKFPPNSVAMKQPLCIQPWDSSPELLKKLFKVFHFLYSHAAILDICSFTVDEFAQAFNDKESLLLGKVHVALLKLLLLNVETEISRGYFSRANKSCKFLGLLHAVEHQEVVFKGWQRYLNSLTWTEILRQVLSTAGFGTKHGSISAEVLNKDVNHMAKYGLSPGTVKGELFSILLMQGNSGSRITDLAKSLSILELNLASSTSELELLISSVLSSDITLFEKISSSGYRLRINQVVKELEDSPTDSEDFGSVDDDSVGNGGYSSADDSHYDSGASALIKFEQKCYHRIKSKMLKVYTEIDESYPGEPWLLGLMEGEYSDLSIEEKLNALVALVDLLSAGSSIRMEEQITHRTNHSTQIPRYGSGAKIKISTTRQYDFSVLCDGTGDILCNKELCSTSDLQPVDSLLVSKIFQKEKLSGESRAKNMQIEMNLHPMQAIFLGSDRRYNRYWLFLGPCTVSDLGHKRIYFESSEDGHWEVIDNEEALCTLLSVLDGRGRREAFLLASLEKREAFLCKTMTSIPNDYRGSPPPSQLDHFELNLSREDSSSAVSDVDNLCLSEIQNKLMSSTSNESGKKELQQKEKWQRLQAFNEWMWNSFYSELNAVKFGKRPYIDSLTRCEHCHDLFWKDEKHCRICHATFELDFDLEERYAVHVATCRANTDTDMFLNHKVLPSQLQSLKAALYAVESVMPEDSLVASWTKSAHNLWIKRLRRTSTLGEFLQVLADFVNAINKGWLCQCNSALSSNCIFDEIIATFQTMPQTSSAVALWLVKLDALIAPHLESIHPRRN